MTQTLERDVAPSQTVGESIVRHSRVSRSMTVSVRKWAIGQFVGDEVHASFLWFGYYGAVLQLDDGRIYGWCRETDANQYQRYRAMLSDDERARCDRFHFARDRHDYANAHDLLRTTLSRCDSRPPDAWRFRATAHGKPVLAPELAAAVPLTFNLSHTRQIVACVVARGSAIGIDIERADRVKDAMSMAALVFSPREVASLRDRQSADARARRFIQLWTLKEAFIKATGKGLSQPLGNFTFDLNEEHSIRFTPPSGVTSLAWQFSQYELTHDVIAAIAVCGAPLWPPVMQLMSGEKVLNIPPTRTTEWAM